MDGAMRRSKCDSHCHAHCVIAFSPTRIIVDLMWGRVHRSREMNGNIALARVERRIARRPDILFDLRWWLSCKVRILIVTDSTSGGFGPTAGFHLGEP